ncbi:MAG TPA: hypothetical protein VNX18_18615 [Bryobacteraceae bacterium]|jgi:hypothetical protein|nr:hypothetical protein [Bryobacteraceae bacterium]
MRPLLLVGILSSLSCFAIDGDAPQMNTISAKAAKPGDILEISGVGLDSTKVDEIYLTDHKFDMKVKVLEQNATGIKLRVPPFAKPGRVQLLVLTKGEEPKLLEQPLYLLIEDPATTEVTQVKKPEAPKPEEALPTPAPPRDKNN